jgi:hypothetical protein
MNVTFTETAVEFDQYPFTAASVYPSGRVEPGDIQEILVTPFPPEIWTKHGEILFVDASCKEALQRFAGLHGIPIVNRVDVWGFLLEEFLDTELTREDREIHYRVLQDNGISREEATAIRASVEGLMLAYNFSSFLWEWVHLGLYDLLQAYSGELTGDRYKLTEAQFREAFWNAMRIQRLGRLLESGLEG